MSQLGDQRIAAFHRKFPDRRVLSLDDLYIQHFAVEGLPKEGCEEALGLLSTELALPIGLLRPTDTMAELLVPVHAGNPLRWIEEWTRAADGKAELNDRIRRRLHELGTLDAWRQLPTVMDVVCAWCGRVPS